MLLRGTDWIFINISRNPPCLNSVLYLMLFAVGFPLRSPDFEPRSVHLRFLVKKVGVGQVLHRVIQFAPFSVIPTRQPIYVQITVRSVRATNFCRSVTYSDCAFVAFFIHHAVRMRHIAICGLPRSIIFFHIIPQTARFSEKNTSVDMKYMFWFSVHLIICNISRY